MRFNFSCQKSVSTVFKLTKKAPLHSDSISQHWISTIYLSREEYELFYKLPGKTLQKERHYFEGSTGEIIGVDQIKTEAGSLWLAEVEFESQEVMEAYQFPMAEAKEVSNEKVYSGFALASSTPKH